MSNQEPPVDQRQVSGRSVRVSNLRVTYGDGPNAVTPFSNVSFEVKEGEFICLIGPSGAGKSTLLFSIAGLVAPSAGEIHVGESLVKGPGGDRAVVFQADAVFPWYTVERNIGYGPEVARWPRERREQATTNALALVELSNYRHFMPGQLSGGMRKRVDVARAFAAGADNILMDEPFGGLDTQTKEGLQESILEIWRATGKTIIFVTHDLEEAAFLADRVIVLKRGGGLEIVEVALPRPRTASMRTGTDLQALRRTLGELIAKAGAPANAS
jgi:NitT/TauT family transport system ATP-binding protein